MPKNNKFVDMFAGAINMDAVDRAMKDPKIAAIVNKLEPYNPAKEQAHRNMMAWGYTEESIGYKPNPFTREIEEVTLGDIMDENYMTYKVVKRGGKWGVISQRADEEPQDRFRSGRFDSKADAVQFAKYLKSDDAVSYLEECEYGSMDLDYLQENVNWDKLNDIFGIE